MRRATSLATLDAELTTEEAAALLGFTREQIYKRVAENAIPHHRVGTRTIRFWKSDLLRLMNGESAPKPPMGLLDLLLAGEEEVTFEITIRRKK